MNLQSHIQRLASLAPSEMPFISIYLNLSDEKGFGHTQHAFVEDRASYFQTEFAHSRERTHSFLRSMKRILGYLDAHAAPETRGIAIFSCWEEEEHFFLVIPLPAPIENRFVVDSVPHIFPLVRFLDQSHHYMVMVSDSEKAKIFEVQFGRIADVRHIMQTQEGKSFRGEWTRMHYQNWKKDKTRRFVKKKIDILSEIMLRKGIQHLMLCGDDLIVRQIRKELPRWLDERVVEIPRKGLRGNEESLIAETLLAFAAFEQASDGDAVMMLQQEVEGDGLGVVGLRQTLHAINLRNIDELLIVDGSHQSSAQLCRHCGWLTDDTTLPDCGHCTGQELIRVNLREELVRKALLAGASIEMITFSEWLERHEGIGALLRYRASPALPQGKRKPKTMAAPAVVHERVL